jgi:5'-nucleotidase
MVNNFIISDEKNFIELQEKFILDGFSNLCVISDFDRTMTKCFVDSKMVSSLISILRSENMLVPGYSGKAQTLFKKYHAIEVDDSLSITEKIPFMEQWWGEHGQLLVNSCLNKKDLEKISTSSDIVFRKNCLESLTLLHSNYVPFVILSASGAGEESVISCLKSRDMYLKNLYVISNKYLWDSDGNAIERVKPYIHTFNKSGTSIVENNLIYSKVSDRKNIILLGDSLGDCNMADGLDYDNVLKIGFLNSDVENKLESYKSNYDVVITDDGEFDFFYDFLKKLE